jgi:hypothetical protein
LLAARQGRWLRVEVVAQAHPTQQFANMSIDGVLLDIGDPQRKRHVLDRA